MELENYFRTRAYTWFCTGMDCNFALEYDTLEELISAVWEHNDREHLGERYPDKLDVTPYDKRFLRGQNISIE